MRSLHSLLASLTLSLHLAAFVGPPPAARSAIDLEQKSVLILLPGQTGLPAASAIAAGVRSTLASASSARIAIETEHVDVARSLSSAYDRHLRELYRQKYAGQAFDLIVAAGNEPLGFLVGARDDLWPGVPVIVCGIDEGAVDSDTVPAGTTGLSILTVRYDVEGTLDAALALLPDTRRVALVGGGAPQERQFHDRARQAVRAFGDRLELIDLTGRPIAELMSRLPTLPERTIVLGSSFLMDGAGRRFYGGDLVEPLSTASNRPLFTVFGTALGRGIVGGSLIDFEAVGRQAGELALRALRHEPLPASPSPTADVSALLFDGRQLHRWGLDERRLPAKSRVLYRQPSLWEQYRWHVGGALVMIAAQAALIVGLLVERQRRRRAQAGLAERLRFETLLADISAGFKTNPAPGVDEHIRECLHGIASFLGMDRGTLWQLSDDRQTLSATHTWTAGGAPSPPPTLAPGAFPLLRALTEQAQVVSVSSLADVPAEAEGERRALEEIGVKSLIAIPLHIEDRPLGILAFVSLRVDRSWPDELVQRLRILGGPFAEVLMRWQTAAALESSEAVSSAMLTALPGEAAILDGAGAITQINTPWAESARVERSRSLAPAPLGTNYLDALRGAASESDQSARPALDLIESVLRGSTNGGVLEYSRPERGELRWFEIRVERLDRPGGGAAIMHFDVTTRKRFEVAARRHLQDMAHLNRVAAMNELASSLAHELNQPLTAILNNAQAAERLLAATPPDLNELRECLADIVEADRRAGEVIRRMRRLIKKEASELVPLDLNGLAQGVVLLVSNDARLHHVTLELVPAPALPVVLGDSVQIQQVILNLLVNAIAAAAEGPDAECRVRVATAVTDAGVELAVHDSGKGIAESDLARVFEPFFTTKREGLGMGLAISRSIVETHGGRIWAGNDVAGGATFRVMLPAHPGS